MVIKSGLILILQLCATLISKLLSWLLLIVYVCGVTGIVMLHHLLLFIRWLLRLTEKDSQQIVTDHDKPVNTATDKGDVLPAEPNCVDTDMPHAASDNDEADNSSQYSSDTDDIADDDDELQHPVSDSSDTGGEQVIAGHGAVSVVKLGQSVECTETNGPQELVLTVDKITEEWRMQALKEKKPEESIQEDTWSVVGNCDDDSESEDEDSKTDGLDYPEQEEQFKVDGAVPKSDDSGTTEAIMTVGQHHNVMIGDDKFASHAEPAEEAIQQHTGEEVNNGGYQQATSTIPSSVDIVTHSDHGMFPNSTTPND